jgi:hypothetical protein
MATKVCIFPDNGEITHPHDGNWSAVALLFAQRSSGTRVPFLDDDSSPAIQSARHYL